MSQQKAVSKFLPEQTLTSSRRRTMNELVDNVNAKIVSGNTSSQQLIELTVSWSAAVSRAGSNVVFVDYDKYVGEFKGRFCEAGVDESTPESNSR